MDALEDEIARSIQVVRQLMPTDLTAFGSHPDIFFSKIIISNCYGVASGDVSLQRGCL